MQDVETIIDELEDDDDMPFERTPIAGHRLLKQRFHPGSASMGSAQRGEKAEREKAERQEQITLMIDKNRLRVAKAAQLRAKEGAKGRAAGQEKADTLGDGLHAIAPSLAPNAPDFLHHFSMMQDLLDAHKLKKRNINK